MLIALALIGGLMVAEVVVGLIAGSVALLTDAGHMLTDAGAIVLGLVALRLAARPPGGAMTFGLKRAEPLSAAINGAVLGVLAVVFAAEAVSRLVNPHHVDAALVLVVALVAIPVNVVAVLSPPDVSEYSARTLQSSRLNSGPLLTRARSKADSLR